MPNDNPGCLTSFLRILGFRNKAENSDATPEKLPYFLRDDFLSPAEVSLFHVLEKMVQGQKLILSKVSLGDLFYVSSKDNSTTYYNKINRKHVDFLLCDPKTLNPFLGIELDDSSHKRADRVERDDFVNEVFAAAGLPLVHVPAQQTYNIQELASLFKQALAQRSVSNAGENLPENGSQEPVKANLQTSDGAPLCPKCGARMVLRTARRGANAGQQFYGCPNYPQCKTILPVAAH